MPSVININIIRNTWIMLLSPDGFSNLAFFHLRSRPVRVTRLWVVAPAVVTIFMRAKLGNERPTAIHEFRLICIDIWVFSQSPDVLHSNKLYVPSSMSTHGQGAHGAAWRKEGEGTFIPSVSIISTSDDWFWYSPEYQICLYGQIIEERRGNVSRILINKGAFICSNKRQWP